MKTALCYAGWLKRTAFVDFMHGVGPIIIITFLLHSFIADRE